MPDDTQHVGLASLRIESVAQRLAIDRQAFVGFGVLGIPALQGLVQLPRVDADEHRAQHAAARHPVATRPIATAKAGPRLLAEILGPLANRLVAAHPTEHRGGGDGQHRGQRMAPALAASRIGDIGEERREGTHLLCAQHDLGGSVVVLGGQHGLRQTVLGLGVQWTHEHPFHRARLGAVARAGAPIAASVAHVLPVGCPVARAVEVARIHERLQQQQRIAKVRRPVAHQAALAQSQHARGEVAVMVARQDQEPTVVGHQVQAVELIAEIPANPRVTRGTLPGRRREAQQRHPLRAPGGDIPQGVADLRQGPQVMMGLHQRLEARLLPHCNGLQGHLAQIHPQTLAPATSCPPFYPIHRALSRLGVNLAAQQRISGENDSVLAYQAVEGLWSQSPAKL